MNSSLGEGSELRERLSMSEVPVKIRSSQFFSGEGQKNLPGSVAEFAGIQ